MSKKRGNLVVLATTIFVLAATLVFAGVAAGAGVDGTAAITAPTANAQVSGTVTVTGTAIATDFQFYKLEFGPGASPTQWSVIGSLHDTQVTNGTLGTWDVAALPAGSYRLKLTVVDNTGNYIEASVPVTVGATARQTPVQTPVKTPIGDGTPAGNTACPRPAVRSNSLTLVPMAGQPASAPPGSIPTRGGVIQGRVLDAASKGLCGLVVKATRNGFQRTATTGADGGYAIAGLEPGTYTVVVEQQICTPASGLKIVNGQALRVDFAQLRQPSAGVSPTVTRRPSSTATAVQARTPTPTASPSPSPTPGRESSGPLNISRWWGWLGIELDFGGLAPHLYRGAMGGFLMFVLGAVILLVRRRK